MKKLLFTLLVTGVLQAQTINLRNDNGVFYVPVKLNGVLKIDMLLDTGACDSNIPPCVANTLIKTGTLVMADVLPNQNYTLADGTIIECKRFILKSLKIGNRTIYNIECSVSKSESSPLLLGGNALKKLKVITLDYTNKKMIIKNGKVFR